MKSVTFERVYGVALVKYYLEIMDKIFDKLLGVYERNAFGVCTWFGHRMKIKSSNIRLAFIYLSFITFASPVFLYLTAAWILKHKEYFKLARKYPTIWEL
jgi:phage shock protein C